MFSCEKPCTSHGSVMLPEVQLDRYVTPDHHPCLKPWGVVTNRFDIAKAAWEELEMWRGNPERILPSALSFNSWVRSPEDGPEELVVLTTFQCRLRWRDLGCFSMRMKTVPRTWTLRYEPEDVVVVHKPRGVQAKMSVHECVFNWVIHGRDIAFELSSRPYPADCHRDTQPDAHQLKDVTDISVNIFVWSIFTHVSKKWHRGPEFGSCSTIASFSDMLKFSTTGITTTSLLSPP